ncbi:transcription factor HRS1-like isoform X2 [Bidens hawaiensis]|uniref:transcription factor HRS1-like isoform X2 n=1 Tax=Bidens hawaiensis TaxID=980011 RepID=UPI00404A0C50
MTAGNTESGNDHSDQTSNECPVLEEFIPMKSTSSTHDEYVDDHPQQKHHSSHESKNTCSNDWLAFTQLSIQTPDPPHEEDFKSKKLLSMEENQNGCGTIRHFPKKKSSADADGEGNGEDKGQANKKERRCWSQELHRRFLNALQHLGGAHATPKQIREFMKVDGLTNDEIKSHLQKYRLHTRRMSPTNYDTHNNPQLVVVGRIWMPPLDYTTNATTSLLTNDIKNAKAVYAPIASLPPSTATSLYKTKQRKQ